MGFFDYQAALVQYQKDHQMEETIHRMEAFDEYHFLRSAAPVEASLPMFVLRSPEQYLRWLKVCDGGLLFDTVLLSVTGVDRELELEFDRLADENTPEVLRELGLPAGFNVIGYRSYGDPICIREGDAHVYLWDCEEQAFDTIWATFHDFVSDEVDTAIELIAEGSLEPIPLKVAEEE